MIAVRGRPPRHARRPDPPPAPRVPPASGTVPTWFARLVLVVVVGVAVPGTIGLALAIAGWFRGPPVLVGGALLTLGLLRFAWGRVPAVTVGRGTTRCAAAVVALAIASFAGNAVFAGEHRLVDRDPGVYVNAGRWLADHGQLEVDAARGPFAAAAEVEYVSAGFDTEAADDRLDPQSNHLLPVLLALGHIVGGADLAELVPPLLAAAALPALFALALRATRRPVAALLVTFVVAVSLPWLAVARSAYTEPLTLLMVASGLWLWTVGLDHRRRGWVVVSGLVLGAAALIRIDAVVYLVPIPIVLAFVVPSRRGERAAWRPPVAGFALALVPGVALGTVDLLVRARAYYDFHTQIRLLWAALAVAIVVGSAGRAAIGRWPGLARIGFGRRQVVADTLAVGAAVVVGLAWLLRPQVQVLRGDDSQYLAAIQVAEGVPVDGTLRYGEDALVWLSWYLGPVALVLGIAGAAIVVRRCVLGVDRAMVLPFAALGAGTALYLWQPSITPDQIWATRRFVPAGIPLLLVLAAIAGDAAARLAVRRGASVGAGQALAGVLAAAVLAPTVATTWPVRSLSDQAGYSAFTDELCAAVDGAAAVFLDGDHAAIIGPQTVRSWCDVPVGIVAGDRSPTLLTELAAAWALEGRQLYVVAADPGLLAAALPGVELDVVGPVVNDRQLELRLLGPPGRYEPLSTTWYVGAVPVP